MAVVPPSGTDKDQLVLSELSVTDVTPQIENAHPIKAIVVRHRSGRTAELTNDSSAEGIVRIIRLFTFEPPDGRLKVCRTGVATMGPA